MFPQRRSGCRERAERSPTLPQDVLVDLGNFSRQIQIANVPGNPNVRQITVTVRYPAPQGWFEIYQVQALISSYR